MLQTIVRAALVGLILFLPSGALAVGALFARESGGSSLSVAGARALVYRDGGREDLILQIGFAGGATEFAWIVPVPTRPSVQPGDPAIFDDLRRMCDPLIVERPGQPKRPRKPPDEPKPVQIDDFSIISPDGQDYLVRWLRDNRYAAPDGAASVLEDYVKRRWWFVVARVRATPAPGARWLAPLWITFQSPKAVLPGRLASLNSKPFAAQLYVAADRITKAAGFTQHCTTDTPSRNAYRLGEFPRFFHVVTQDRRLTELRGLLDPKKLESDVLIVPK